MAGDAEQLHKRPLEQRDPGEISAGIKKIFEMPKGTTLTAHPSGDGWLCYHKDHPTKWVHGNGMVEVVPSK